MFRRTTTLWTLLALATLAVLGSGPLAAGAACIAPPGDVTNDGAATVSDVQCAILAALWAVDPIGIAEPACTDGAVERADLNCDSGYTVADVQLTIGLALELGLPSELDGDGNACVDACESEPPTTCTSTGQPGCQITGFQLDDVSLAPSGAGAVDLIAGEGPMGTAGSSGTGSGLLVEFNLIPFWWGSAASPGESP